MNTNILISVKIYGDPILALLTMQRRVAEKIEKNGLWSSNLDGETLFIPGGNQGSREQHKFADISYTHCTLHQESTVETMNTVSMWCAIDNISTIYTREVLLRV